MSRSEIGFLIVVLVILALIFVAPVVIISTDDGNKAMGTVICPVETHYGEVYFGYRDAYAITTESGQRILAPKNMCTYKSEVKNEN